MNKIFYYLLIAALVAQISSAPADDPKKPADDAAKAAGDAAKDAAKDVTTPAVTTPTTPTPPTPPVTPPTTPKPPANNIVKQFQKTAQDMGTVFGDFMSMPGSLFG